MNLEAVQTTFQKYPAYKDSGVDWLGEIPEGWEIQRLASLGRFTASGIDKLSKKGESPVKIINYTDVYKNLNYRITNEFRFMIVTTPESNRKKHLVKKGDLIFLPSSETFEDLGLCALIDETLENTSFSYHVLRFEFNKEIDHNFKKYFTNNKKVLIQFSRSGTGSIRKTLSRNDFRNSLVIIPLLPEQTAIANFLDEKTSKIDQAIAKKEKMIALLKERKQIIIQNAVTGKVVWSEKEQKMIPLALSEVKGKDSGVEWIGEIPKHWEVKRLKNVCQINTDTLPDNTYFNFRFNYVDIGSVSFENGIEETESFDFKSAPSRARRLAKNGDTIISTVRTYLKAIDFVSEEKSNLIYSTGFAVLSPTGILNTFLYHFVRSNAFTEQVMVNSKGMSYPAINSTGISRLSLTIPPIEEQGEVGLHIKSKSIKIDEIIDLQHTQIEKLKEYKATLIDSAVTGKIKISLT
jgi:type I restriction enzyme S subunit